MSDQAASSFQSRLPGDAPLASPPSPTASASASSSSPAPPRPSQAVTLTSISQLDPSKQRAFTAKYYRPPAAAAAPAASLRAALDLPDSYFQPTSQELERAHAHAVQHRQHLVDRPLLTQKLRDRDRAEKDRKRAARWPETTVRVRFADRSQLEGTFASAKDKLVHVYEFVRLALKPHLRHVPFVLYQSPPRTEYRRSDPALRTKTLLDLDFAPSTSLYLKFEPPSPPPPPPTEPSGAAPARPPVDMDWLNAPTTSPSEYLIPDLIAIATDLPLPPSFDPTQQQPPATATPSQAPAADQDAELKKKKEERLRKLLGGGAAGGRGPFGSTKKK
ncbi:hypothetical protein JCM3774_004540 [Rhodotorula dairenensis]